MQAQAQEGTALEKNDPSGSSATVLLHRRYSQRVTAKGTGTRDREPADLRHQLEVGKSESRTPASADPFCGRSQGPSNDV